MSFGRKGLELCRAGEEWGRGGSYVGLERRGEEGWDQRQLALAADIGYGTIVGLEKGMTQRLSEKVLLALRKVGAPEDLDRQYATWREATGAALRGEVDPLSIKNPLSFN